MELPGFALFYCLAFVYQQQGRKHSQCFIILSANILYEKRFTDIQNLKPYLLWTEYFNDRAVYDMSVSSGGVSGAKTKLQNTETDTNWMLVVVATLSGTAAALQVGKAAAALPLIRSEFQSDLTLLSFYMAILSIVAATGGIWFGRFVRKIDARPAGLSGLVIITLGSVVGALAPTVSVLVFSRIVEALGFALVATSMPSIIQGASAERHKATTLGIWAAWLPAGVALAMLISYFVMDEIGWRGVYWVCALLVLLSALLLYSSTEKNGSSPTNQEHVQLRTLFRSGPLLIAGIFIMFAAANMIIMGFMPTLLVDTLKFSHSTATLVSFLAAFILLPSNIAAGWFVDLGFNRKLMFYISLLLMGGMSLIIMHPEIDAGIRITTIFLLSLATGVPPSLIWASIPFLAKDRKEAPLISGLLYQGSGIGQVMGPITAGAAVQYSGSWFAAGWVICVLLAVSLLFTALLPDE